MTDMVGQDPQNMVLLAVLGSFLRNCSGLYNIVALLIVLRSSFRACIGTMLQELWFSV